MRTQVTIKVVELVDVPVSPAIYAMYAGPAAKRYCVYIGLASNLRRRLRSHLVLRNSSVATGVSPVSLNVDLVTEIDWWLNEHFNKSIDLAASELIAFEVFDPMLRSRAHPSYEAKQRASNDDFRQTITALFRQVPNGRLIKPSAESLKSRIEALELRVAALEQVHEPDPAGS